MSERFSTIKGIRSFIADLAEMAGDAESAHSAEDQLHQGVLAIIANGEHDDSAAALAREALKSRDLDFPRWCA